MNLVLSKHLINVALTIIVTIFYCSESSAFSELFFQTYAEAFQLETWHRNKKYRHILKFKIIYNFIEDR